MNRRSAVGPVTIVVLALGVALPIACSTAEPTVDPALEDGGGVTGEGGPAGAVTPVPKPCE